MNFFEHQDRARRNSGWLVGLLLLAVTSLILITTAVVAAFIYYFQFRSDQHVRAFDSGTSIFDLATQAMTPQLLGSITLVVVAVVALGSLFKWVQLKRGGNAVAEALGGRLLNTSSRNHLERQALNVVEEMAIASGTPVPPLYLIEDDAINAFAAGHSPQDAVIGLTRGSLEQLDRDQLQGVIAHEFSHILHGDMRLNMRLVGILHGILAIGLIGEWLARSSSHRHSSRNNQGGFVLGLALMAVGYAGTFFGNIIKAAVSRQREFLADASAVQFTRNPTGIAGALKSIGGYPAGSQLGASNASEFSHLYFGEGIKRTFAGLMATHPPLDDRIRRIEPRWRGDYPAPKQPSAASEAPAETAASHFGAANAGHAVTEPAIDTPNIPENKISENDARTTVPPALAMIGQPDKAHLDLARGILNTIDNKLREAARDPFSARALVYALLLSNEKPAREQQLQLLRQKAHPVVFKLLQALAETVSGLERSQHLNLLDLCLPALKALSAPQYQVFKRNLALLIRHDAKVELFEWALYRIVTRHLESQRRSLSGSHSIKHQASACQLLLSMLAHSGHSDPAAAREAYAHGVKSLEVSSSLELLERTQLSLPALDKALEALNQLKPLQKPLLLKAMAQCVMHDGEVKTVEAELIRAIADSLECPIPPLLPDQSLI